MVKRQISVCRFSFLTVLHPSRRAAVLSLDPAGHLPLLEKPVSSITSVPRQSQHSHTPTIRPAGRTHCITLGTKTTVLNIGNLIIHIIYNLFTALQRIHGFRETI